MRFWGPLEVFTTTQKVLVQTQVVLVATEDILGLPLSLFLAFIVLVKGCVEVIVVIDQI